MSWLALAKAVFEIEECEPIVVFGVSLWKNPDVVLDILSVGVKVDVRPSPT